MRSLVIFALVLLTCAGCAQRPPKSRPAPVAPASAIDISGQVYKSARIAPGLKLAVQPFRAGPHAEANETLDEISTLLVASLRDKLQNSHLRLIPVESPYEADIVLDGYIEELTIGRRRITALMRKKPSRFAVSGMIYSRKDSVRLVSFGASLPLRAKKNNFEEIADRVGEAVAHYIVTEAGQVPL